MNEVEILQSVGLVAFDAAEHVRAIIESKLTDATEDKKDHAVDAINEAWAWIFDRDAPRDQGLGPRVMAVLLAFRLLSEEIYCSLAMSSIRTIELTGQSQGVDLTEREQFALLALTVARNHISDMRREGRDILTPPMADKD